LFDFRVRQDASFDPDPIFFFFTSIRSMSFNGIAGPAMVGSGKKNSEAGKHQNQQDGKNPIPS
jgi:hypothetical protein